MQIEIRTVSQNGQVALPRRFLEALGLTPPVKVRVIQERDQVVIRRSPASRMSDEDFSAFLEVVQKRNSRITQRQVAKSIRQARQNR